MDFFMPMSETKFQFVSAHLVVQIQRNKIKTKQTGRGEQAHTSI